MNKEEKEYKSAVLQLQTALDFHNSNSLGEYNVNWASVELILEYIENLQKKAEHQKQMIKSQYGTIKSINKTSKNRKEAIKSLLVQNEKLKKKAEQGEHYKHLYSEVKKQKDDVVEYIKTTTYSDITGLEKHNITEFWFIKDLLRMLGEIDE